MEWMPQAIRDGIIVVLVISGPLVLAAAFIGLAIGILQAATQVQEQTIGSALKIIGVFALIIFAGFWMYQYLNQYTSRAISSAFTFIPHLTPKAVPSDAFKEEESFERRINLESTQGQLKVIQPEKLETKIPEGGLPPTAPFLGSPEIPTAPKTVTKLSPPTIPQIPKQPIKPNIPLSDYEEPKAIPPVGLPEVQGDTQAPQNIVDPQEDSTNQINLLPKEKTQDMFEDSGLTWLE